MLVKNYLWTGEFPHPGDPSGYAQDCVLLSRDSIFRNSEVDGTEACYGDRSFMCNIDARHDMARFSAQLLTVTTTSLLSC